MEISLFGFVLGLLLLAIPFYIVYVLKLHELHKLFNAIGVMLISVLLVGAGMFLLLKWNNVALTIISGVVMALLSSVFTIRKARLKVAKLFFPVVSGTLLSVFLIGIYVLFLVLGLHNPFEVRFFVPVLGLLTGCIIGANAHALHIYYMGSYHHQQLYYYILGNGGTHLEATNYFVRRAFQAALNPMMRQMSGVVLFNAPVLMLALVMSGVDLATAMALQILLFIMILAASFASLFLTLIIGRKYNFDAYNSLRPMAEPTAPKAAQSPVSETSANLLAPRHTDSENQPQE
ncbi:MAG: ABC transporter permease [Prevotella sp.]|jgi:putative ABC transport system permease protein